MRTVGGTIGIKYLINAFLAVLILPAVGRVGWAQALWLAAIVAGVSYVVSDRLTLPALGNAGAVLADFVLAVGILSFAGFLAPGARLHFGGALVTGGAIATAEIIYHQYLLERGVGVMAGRPTRRP